MGEVGRIADEGTPAAVARDTAFAGVTRCRRMCVLIALVGPAIAYHNNETLTKAFPERFYLSENLHKVVEAGKTVVLMFRRKTRSRGGVVARGR